MLQVGPKLLPDILNGQNYLEFLEEEFQEAMEEAVAPNHRPRIWFQHDGAPAHYSALVRDHLNRTFPGQWIGRGGPVRWPPRSPDLNPLDFFYGVI